MKLYQSQCYEQRITGSFIEQNSTTQNTLVNQKKACTAMNGKGSDHDKGLHYMHLCDNSDMLLIRDLSHLLDNLFKLPGPSMLAK